MSSDPTRIQAPPEQHGLIDTHVVLNCSTTFEETSTISFTWTHHGETWSDNGQIERVSLDNEGMYKCSVLLGTYGLRMEKKINFSVIGESEWTTLQIIATDVRAYATHNI